MAGAKSECPGRSFVVTARSCLLNHPIIRTRKSVRRKDVNAVGKENTIVKKSLMIPIIGRRATTVGRSGVTTTLATSGNIVRAMSHAPNETGKNSSIVTASVGCR